MKKHELELIIDQLHDETVALKRSRAEAKKEIEKALDILPTSPFLPTTVETVRQHLHTALRLLPSY